MKIGIEMVVEDNEEGTTPEKMVLLLKSVLGFCELNILEITAYDMDKEVAGFLDRLKKKDPPADKEK
jgi:hypothetical protein